MTRAKSHLRKAAMLAVLPVLACGFGSAMAQGVSGAQRGTRSAEAEQLHEAIMTAQRGDGAKALALTRALLASHPGYEPALKFQGALLEDMGHAPEAAASFQEALKLAPGDAELMLKWGVNRLVAGDTGEAIRLFTQRLKQVPQDGDTLYYLAQAYHLRGDSELALKAIQRSLKADPNNTAVWQKYGELLCSSGDNEAALRWLLKAQHADPTLGRIDFDLGVASFKNQDLENAAQYAAKAVALKPNDLKGLQLLAAVDVKLSKWQEAKPVFEQILSIQPADDAALLGLGHCELALKNYQAAADLLERLLKQDPTQVLAHFYLARVYAGLGRTADAQHEAELHGRLLDQAASVVPTDEREVEKATLVEARQLLTEGHEAAALKLFRDRAKGPTATPGAPYMLTGVVYLYMGRPEDAERCLKQSMVIEPTVRGAHTYLGMLALQQNDLEKAESEFKAELQGEPNYQLAVAELGEVRYRQGRWEEAADQLARSKTVVPALLYMLCDSYFHLGKVKDADLTAELAVGYGKSDPAITKGILDLLERNQQTELVQRLSSR